MLRHTVRLIALVAIVASVAAPSLVQAQNLIVNGSFESPVAGNGQIRTFTQGQTIGSGWWVEQSELNAVVYDTNYAPFPGTPPAGRQALYVCNNGWNGTVSQNVTLVSGRRYMLFWKYAGLTLAGNGSIRMYRPDGVNVLWWNLTPSTSAFSSWQDSFLATQDGPYTLRLSQVRTSTLVFDDIKMYACPYFDAPIIEPWWSCSQYRIRWPLTVSLDQTLTFTWKRGSTVLGTSSGSYSPGSYTFDVAMPYPSAGVSESIVLECTSSMCSSSNTATVSLSPRPAPADGPLTPSNISVVTAVGLTAYLGVNEFFAAGVTYNWYKGSVAPGNMLTDDLRVSGAHSRSLSISNAAGSDSGTYLCQAVSPCGESRVSTPITLTVSPPTQFITQPVDQTLACGVTSATLTGEATGVPPLTYQWWGLDFRPVVDDPPWITGAQTPTLTLQGLAPGSIWRGILRVTGATGLAVWSQDVAVETPSSLARVVQSPAGPPPRERCNLVHDQSSGHLVLFGGRSSPYAQFLEDTWEYDGTHWLPSPALGPLPRSDASMTFDSVRQRCVLFGGLYSNGLRSDTWEYANSAWTQRNVPGPSARFGAAMAFDPSRARVVLYGGNTGSGLSSETWEFDGTAWSVLPLPGPGARRGASMAFDPQRQGIVLHGGEDDSHTLTDTWQYDGTAWTQVSAAGPYPGVWSAPDNVGVASNALCYDSTRGRLVFVDEYQSPWILNGSRWIEMGVDPMDDPFSLVAVAFDEALDSVVGLGLGYPNQTATVQLRPVLAVIAQPSSVLAHLGEPVSLTFQTAAQFTATYQWYKAGVPVVDDAIVHGAQASTLTIDAMRISDYGRYTCTAQAGCSSVTSAMASIAVCSSDMNADGNVDSDDLFTFLDVWFALNGQGGSGLVADIDDSHLVDADDLFLFLDRWFEQNGTCS